MRTHPMADAEPPWLAWCRMALYMCGCDHEPEAAPQCSGAPRLKCYYDLDHELVVRQLEFRRVRKLRRDASANSLSSLGTVSEEMEGIMPRIQSTPAMMATFAMDLARFSPGDNMRKSSSGDSLTPPGSLKTAARS